MYLVSPTDRELLAAMRLKVSAMSHRLPEQYGADVLTAVEGVGVFAVQRKSFPDDFIASLADGRLTRELPLLKSADYGILIVEGTPVFTSDGNLFGSYTNRWTKEALRNVLRSVLLVHGIPYEHTEDMHDTVDRILEIGRYLAKGVHRSLLARPKRDIKDGWGVGNKRDFARFFLQGFQGVGPIRAEKVFDAFGKIPLCWTVSQEELGNVLGEKTAKSLFDALGG